MSKYTGLEIAVIGMSGKFPGADNINDFWENLKSGKESIGFFTDEEILNEGEDKSVLENPNYVKANAYVEGKEFFDARFFAYRPDEALLMDPQVRLFHQCVWEAIEDAGYDVANIKEKVGLFSGSATDVNWSVYASLLNRDNLVDEFSASQLSNARFMSTRISYLLDLHGPSVFLDTACSTSLVAVANACKSLILAECSMAIAGGVSLSNKSKKGYLYQEGMIHSRDGHCRTFDAEATGTVSGEGAGVVILKMLKNAIKDRDNIYAIIRGSGVNNDGNAKVGFTAPSIDGQTEAILMAQKWAKVSPESISYVEAHGTATPLGDPIEVSALTRAFGKSDKKYCALGAVKSNIGHLDSAAGVAGFIKTVLALKHRQIPPSLHFTSSNPKINFEESPFYVNTKLSEWVNEAFPLRAGVSSFGIGGTNAHVVLEEAPKREADGPGRPVHVLVFSAKTRPALLNNIERFRQHLEKNPGIHLPDAAYTLKVGRSSFSLRYAITADSTEEVIQSLKHVNLSDHITPVPDNSPVVFMFSGQGSQYVKMAAGLYHSEPIFCEKVDECMELLGGFSDLDFAEVLLGYKGEEAIHETKYTQPLLFVIEYALASLLISWGIVPDKMIGHSLGEYVAAYLSGVWDLEDALKLVVKRGELMQKAAEGVMLSLRITEDELLDMLKNHPDLDLATINSSESFVVAGSKQNIALFKSEVGKLGHACKLLNTSHAFHSAMMDEIVDDFKKVMEEVDFKPMQIPFISNLTGEYATDVQISQPDYWVNHLRHTVQFSKGLDLLLETPNITCIEVGPGRSLGSFVMNHAKKASEHKIISTIRDGRDEIDDLRFLLNNIAKLWRSGGEISWKDFYAQEERNRLSLPTYAFDKETYPVNVDVYDFITNELQQKSDDQSIAEKYIYHADWKRTLSPNGANELKERSHNFVIFSGQEQFSASMINYLTLQGQQVWQVVQGDGFKIINKEIIQVNLYQNEGVNELWSYFESNGISIDHIIYNLALSDQSSDNHYKDIDQKLHAGYLGLSYIGKSLTQTKQDKPLELTVFNNFIFKINENDEVDPLKTTIKAPLRIIPLEVPQIRSRLIDIPYPFKHVDEQEMYVATGVNEMFYHAHHDVVAYRHHSRWEPYFEQLDDHEKMKSDCSIKKGGNYIITGGLGGMGLSVAHDISLKQVANVMLVHHSPFPERKEWDQWIAEKGHENALSIKILQLMEMEKSGAKIQLFMADLALEKDVEKLASHISASVKNIDGLVWAAGEVDYGGIMLNRDKEDFIKYTSSKIHGLLLFKKYFDLSEVDFIALFSSMGNVFYHSKFGQVAYNAANEFLENYAHHMQHETNHPRIFTINWCDWYDVGMSYNTIRNKIHSQDASEINQSIDDGISPAEGVKIFNECLRSRIPVAYIYPNDLPSQLKNSYGQTVEKDTAMAAIPDPVMVKEETCEKKVIRLFVDFFGDENINQEANFFDLGGDSLSGMTLIARINQAFDTKLNIKDLYQFPIVSELASQLEKHEKTSFSKILKANKKPYYKLSAAQRRLFFLHEFDRQSLAYNMPQIMWLEGALDLEQLDRSFHQLIMLHETLRTSFEIVDNQPVQKVAEHSNDFSIKYIDHEDKPETKIEAHVEAFVRPFELRKGSLINVGLIRVNKDRHLLMLDMHHIISDLISYIILMRDLSAYYAGQLPPALPLQYRDYAEWEQSESKQEEIKKQKAFWLEEFSPLPQPLYLPTDFSRPAVRGNEGSIFHFNLDMEETHQLKALAKKNGTSMFMLTLSLYNILLSKLTNQEDIVIGSPISGRSQPELEEVVGMFVNTLLLRNQVKGNCTFETFLADVKDKTLNCFSHQHIAYETLIDELEVERDTSRNPLFDVMFSYQNLGRKEVEIPGISLQPYEVEHTSSQFDMTFTVLEGEQLSFDIEYSTQLFTSETIKKFTSYFKKIVKAVIQNYQIEISQINLLGEVERNQLLHDFNNTQRLFERQEVIPDMFEKSVASYPAETALICGDEKWSYEQLNNRINLLALKIREKGAKKGDIIGLLMPRTCDAIASIFAILKAGCAYLPIDPDYPEERVKYMIYDSEVKLVISDPSVTYEPSEAGIEVMYTESVQQQDQDDLQVHFDILPSNLAYLIYTSGSTGHPKGVMVKHSNVVNLVHGIREKLELQSTDTILCLTTVSFDIFVLEAILPLLLGMRVVLAQADQQKEMTQITGLVRDHKINILQMTPSHLRMVLAHTEGENILKNVNDLLVGGEAFPQQLFVKLKKVYKGNIHNMYGPTETTVWSTIADLTHTDRLTIGRPIANTKVYVLDKHRKMQPVGSVGEIWIAGEGVARGYWKNKELTAEKFVTDPFAKEGYMYHTGDIGCWQPDGNLEYKGRGDHQVKIRGHRIELGEIESQLSEHQLISAAVIEVKEHRGEQYLVAYYVSDEVLDVDTLKAYLQLTLPTFMIPSYYVYMDALPMTPNGKVNRQALPDTNINAAREYIAPKSEVEKKLLDMWTEILELEPEELVSTLDSFFDIGGHSVHVMILSDKIYHIFDINLTLKEIFLKPTIQMMAESIEARLWLKEKPLTDTNKVTKINI